MAIVVKEPDQKDFEHPEDGQYLGVIADVIDLGEDTIRAVPINRFCPSAGYYPLPK